MRDADGLTMRQRAFVDALLTPNTREYLNFTRAYLFVYPRSSYAAARSSSCELLTKPNILGAMAKQWNIEQMSARLKRYVSKLEQADNLPQARQTIMDYAELTGQLIHKSETKITDADRDDLRGLLREAIAVLPVAADGAQRRALTVDASSPTVADPSATTLNAPTVSP